MSTFRGIPLLFANEGVDNSYWDAAPTLYSNFTSDGTTNQQSVTGLSYAVLANSKYELEVVLVGQSSSVAGTNLGISFSAAGATGGYLIESVSTSANAATSANVIGTIATGTFWTSATTDLFAYMKSVVIIGANAGNITIEVKKLTSGTVTIKTGSAMRVKQLA